MAILEVKSLNKIYTTRFGGNQVEALSNVSFLVEQGEYIAIMGESGSGKTTLLNILAALDTPTGGEVILDGENLSTVKENQILDTFSLYDNISLPLVLMKKEYPEIREKVETISYKLGIHELLRKFPYEVSGGQKQRVAVARALITEPKLVLADEPTGALDSSSTDSLLNLFNKINEEGQTILMVTHSIKAASHAGRVLFIKDGEVFHQIYRGNNSNQEMYQKISDTLTFISTGGELDD